MRILYAVQATGNGHISRAMELLPHLSRYGQVDVFLSGSNSSLDPQLPVRFRNKGISLFYTKNGKINLLKTALNINPVQMLSYARQLPLQSYNLVLNDFESITSLACTLQRVPSLHFGHQASFSSPKTPRPKIKSLAGELTLKYYAKGTAAVGLHFQAYDDNILPPVIKSEIWQAQPTDKGYFCVYLPSFTDEVLLPYLSKIREHTFQIFSRQVKKTTVIGNCHLFPVEKKAFNNSLIHAAGLITNAGFETPAEAMFLHKKILAIPIRGQYEQYCNAAAMAQLGVHTLDQIDEQFTENVKRWIAMPSTVYHKSFHMPTATIIDRMMQIADEQNIITAQSHQLLFG
ncbi:glycosyl transferase [Taibaiella sp. KBW10]|uniref:glycosyltransferase family protein n=1 Tax=Taibaiella sp. KBW10 TaxID=2153357 RepID=UPI000F597D6F|nr:glycosyltransferase family protein [Taibaiella sp. KBW10]RQO30113.1 glycosyl transferase [Taibaiella sp. KBW10]